MFVIDKLWWGENPPCEKSHPKDKRTQKLSSELTTKSMVLNSTMSEEVRAIWEDYSNTRSELETLSEETAYTDGIRFGILLMLDVLTAEENRGEGT